jgi:hypothetical protein
VAVGEPGAARVDERALKQAKEGEFEDLGSFAQYADDEE